MGVLKGSKTMKKKRLTIEDRILIEQLLKLNYKLKDIANAIDSYSSTISREIKNRRVSNNSLIICNKTNYNIFFL